MLLTVNDGWLLPTVVSRCQRLELPPLSVAGAAAALEERDIAPERARLLAGLSHGCLGWALVVEEDDSLLRQRGEELDKIIGVIKGGGEERFAYAARLASRFSQNRRLVYDELGLWLDLWRDLMLLKLGCCDIITNIDRRDELAGLAAGYRLDRIRSFIGGIRAAAGQLRQNANAQLALEVLVLDIPDREGGEEPASRFSIRNG